jgi:TRAP-type mannitol/chloroaromatic compound transport system permease large subunit
MLNRLPLIDILFRVANRLMRRTPAAPYLAGIALGALFAPMNGSVGASVAMLARAILPRLKTQGVTSESGAALICTASTIGVVVPPSLVLILLGDAMMRAHTEAVTATGSAVRVINTQDIFHGALLPAALMLLLFFLVTWWRHRHSDSSIDAPVLTGLNNSAVTRHDWIVASCSVLCILALLISVTLGYLYAVEGAATGGLVLVFFGLVTRTLTRPLCKVILSDTMAITGALFALLVAASTYTLVLRAFETDLWISDFLHGLSGGGSIALGVVLLILVVSAFVLDAFEIMFVIIPIVMPPLLMLVPDVTWVAVLTLLVLQMSFLLPPFGYAILMASSILHKELKQRVLAAALLPYLIVQAGVVLLVLCWPCIVWHNEVAAVSDASNHRPLSNEEIQQLFEQQRLQNEKESPSEN